MLIALPELGRNDNDDACGAVAKFGSGRRMGRREGCRCGRQQTLYLFQLTEGVGHRSNQAAAKGCVGGVGKLIKR